ncbi:calmodulin, putative [Eimeria praecox]|uniref:Calmodulin n=1 Tax=Eimeria praecox TaxID=51316 RepID=U6G3M3_9EIME|nr:calmodulin, putative [Eimeria praecox]
MHPFPQGPLGLNVSNERGRRRNVRPERYDASLRAPASTIFFSKPSKPKTSFSVDVTSTGKVATPLAGKKHQTVSLPGLQEEALECFRLYDRDGDGLVPVTDVASMLRSLGFVVRIEQIKDFEAEMRRLKTTSVNFETFSSIVNKGLPRTVDPADVLDAFHLLDREKKGSVNVEELHHLMTTVGDPLSEADWQTLLSRTLITRESVTPASLKSGTFLRLICAPADDEDQGVIGAALTPQTLYNGPLP